MLAQSSAILKKAISACNSVTLRQAQRDIPFDPPEAGERGGGIVPDGPPSADPPLADLQ
ncbi:MAG: hypothetical protein ACP5JH_11715 [Bacteroidota bacterium]